MNRRQLLAGATAALTSSCVPTSPAPAAEAPLIVFGEELSAEFMDEFGANLLRYYIHHRFEDEHGRVVGPFELAA